MSNDTGFLEKIEEYVRNEMEGVCSAHDFFHIERVVKLAAKIREMEGEGDLFVVKAGALLHESLDEKFFQKTNIKERKDAIRSFLLGGEVEEKRVENILFIAENVGYGKSLERGEDFHASKEFQIVEDADRLEAIGAVAIARTFTYGGKKKRPIYDPSIKPKKYFTREKYINADSSSINHFYEKLLLLKGMMHTQSGKELAQERHDFMEIYLDQFYKEWNL